MSGFVLALGAAAGMVLFFLTFASGRRALAWAVGGGALAAGFVGAGLLGGTAPWAAPAATAFAVLLWGWIHLASRWVDADEEAARHYPEFSSGGVGAGVD
ncbi:hypothetical protein SAMN05421803_103370 [Nocardiopsis flavescens]|uniref:Uncharacterized protein n=1 Tax=Nocardiopsis flavescens TaxID=758803 RepID=A0A1M6GDE1_9ACTN|nr:hypothetical protein [Nocardiopsis flavescens]SHJ07958.1 hypothetical protein SAMN05421803_103370 [Nocardiopsis flavescens]